MLQLPSPIEQAIEHVPALHEGVPPLFEHTLVQLPQYVLLELVFVSQPLAFCPSQFPNPELQTIEQAPPVHEADPFAVPQAALQDPQF